MKAPLRCFERSRRAGPLHCAHVTRARPVGRPLLLYFAPCNGPTRRSGALRRRLGGGAVAAVSATRPSRTPIPAEDRREHRGLRRSIHCDQGKTGKGQAAHANSGPGARLRVALHRRSRSVPATPRTADAAASTAPDTLANPTNVAYRRRLSQIQTIPPVASPPR